MSTPISSSTYRLTIGNRNYSSWSLRGWLVMKASGLEFECALHRLFTEEGMDVIRRESPNAKVPYLVHKDSERSDLILSESLAIAEYMAEQAPDAGLWPSDALARAEARGICAQMATGFLNIRGDMPMNIRRENIAIDYSENLLKEVATIEHIWAYCREKFGTGGLFLFGEFSNVDAFFAPVIWRFNSYRPHISSASKAYIDNMLDHPFMKEWADLARTEKWVVEEEEV